MSRPARMSRLAQMHRPAWMRRPMRGVGVVLTITLALVLGLGCAKDSVVTDAVSVTSLDTISGPRSGYQNVTIQGTGFGGVTGVSFGSADAIDFTVADSNRIVAVTPPDDLGAVVDVTLTTAAGALTLPGAYTYWDYDLKLSKGAAIATYTLDQIRDMAPATGYWGAINDKPYQTDRYRGVPLLLLLEAVGGWSAGEEITVKSADGFSATYTTEMLEQMAGGTYPMWNLNGAPVITDDRFAQLLVSYEIDASDGEGGNGADGGGASAGDADDLGNWQPLKAGKGPFRIVASTAQDDRLSQGPANPALVVSIAVDPGSAASTPSSVTSPVTAASGDGTGAEAVLDPASGPRSGYQSVTIQGIGFDSVTAVSFGSVDAVDFTVVDNTRLVVVTPPGELGAVVDVTLTTAAGALTLPGAYTYWDYDLKLSKGTDTATYTLDDLAAMTTVTGYWGAHKDPVPHLTDRYRGVPLLTLLEAVGGWSPGEEITVKSADGFSAVYTTEMLEQMAGGTYPMWNISGTPVITGDRFAQPVVAFEIAAGGGESGGAGGDSGEWQPLEAGTGPLRVVLLTAEPDRVNQGKFNPFLAVSVEVTKP